MILEDIDFVIVFYVDFMIVIYPIFMGYDRWLVIRAKLCKFEFCCQSVALVSGLYEVYLFLPLTMWLQKY